MKKKAKVALLKIYRILQLPKVHIVKGYIISIIIFLICSTLTSKQKQQKQKKCQQQSFKIWLYRKTYIQQEHYMNTWIFKYRLDQLQFTYIRTKNIFQKSRSDCNFRSIMQSYKEDCRHSKFRKSKINFRQTNPSRIYS